jgi:hypothetical protein
MINQLKLCHIFSSIVTLAEIYGGRSEWNGKWNEDMGHINMMIDGER